ncbi:MAG TPA: glycosyltransferase [Acidimicrobiales bacterium]|nr:glycosyltransferase [Acidimicrobiales bacterium]
MATQSPGSSITMTAQPGSKRASMVVCSLEPWGTVRRRIRILVDQVVELDQQLRVLYVAPAVDIPHELKRGHIQGVHGPRLEQVHPRITVLRPRKWLPRSIGPYADRSLERQILHAVAGLGLEAPVLWINDAAYAQFSLRTGWPTLYDITDDWLLAPMAPRQRERLVADEALLMEHSRAVVVCSPDLARSRGGNRKVELIPNGVDVEMFRTPRARPSSLPRGPVALYVGTLHAERVDVPLILELATARPGLQIALVGPNSLPSDVTAQLERVPNIHLLGPQPYELVPAFLQHADVVVIPHLVNPFTESLDPIKAYECLAAGRPTIATPVAGFRQLGPPIVVADRSHFVEATSAALAGSGPEGPPGAPDGARIPSWRQRAETMASVLAQVRRQGARR